MFAEAPLPTRLGEGHLRLRSGGAVLSGAHAYITTVRLKDGERLVGSHGREGWTRLELGCLTLSPVPCVAPGSGLAAKGNPVGMGAVPTAGGSPSHF